MLLIVTLLLAVSASAADDLLKWNKTPEAYYMTTEEKAEWKNVSTPDQAQKFIDEYYRKRGEQFRKDVRTRMDLADAQFKLDKIPGSRTQRGRVWMILGNPSRAKTNRDVDPAQAPTRSFGNRVVPDAPSDTAESLPSQFRAIERKGLMTMDWVYEHGALDPELKMPSLNVRFQIDMSKGAETIDNPGFVEPALTKMADLISSRYMAAAATQNTQRSMMPSAQPATAASTAPDPLWNSTPALNGVMFTGDTFLSPTEEPYYAYSFYVPKSATALGDWKSGLLVTLVRNEAGQQVVSQRTPVDLTAYDSASGARYVDRSVTLPAGKYEGLFALYTPDGATLLSSHKTSFEVTPKETPRASGLFLTSRIETLEKQDPFDPFTFVATKYAVRADRQFRTADKLAFYTVIANPTGSPNPNIMQKMTFKRDGKEFARTPLEPAQLTQTGPNTFLVGNAFDPETFPAGHYTLELQVRDMAAPDSSPLKTPGYVLTSEFDVIK
jgi:GWxTD domain-containing protein